MRSLIETAVLRLSSLTTMAYVIAFLLIRGGTADVGAYSVVLAVTAPVVMFLMFRYVEGISLAADKRKEFSISLVVAVGGFLIAIPPIYLAGRSFEVDPLFLSLLILHKPFEIAADLFTTMEAASGERRVAIRSVFIRLAGVVSGTSLLVTWFSPLLSIAITLLFVYALTTLLHDVPRTRATSSFRLYGFSELLEFVRSRYPFGVLNFAVSLNSSMPRYLIGGSAGLSSLGIFTVLYQVSATAVNILQYPISLHAHQVRSFVERKTAIIWLVIGCSAVFVALCVPMIVGARFPNVESELTFEMLVVFSSIVASMFIVLLLRGLLLTSLIAANAKVRLYLIVLISMAAGVLICYPTLRYSSPGMEVYAVALFVLSSSITSAVLLVRELGPDEGRYERP